MLHEDKHQTWGRNNRYFSGKEMLICILKRKKTNDNIRTETDTTVSGYLFGQHLF